MKKYIDTNNEFNAFKDKCANSISEQRMEITQLMIDLEKVKQEALEEETNQLRLIDNVDMVYRDVY